jgi:hypothetical protein
MDEQGQPSRKAENPSAGRDKTLSISMQSQAAIPADEAPSAHATSQHASGEEEHDARSLLSALFGEIHGIYRTHSGSDDVVDKLENCVREYFVKPEHDALIKNLSRIGVAAAMTELHHARVQQPEKVIAVRILNLLPSERIWDIVAEENKKRQPGMLRRINAGTLPG